MSVTEVESKAPSAKESTEVADTDLEEPAGSEELTLVTSKWQGGVHCASAVQLFLICSR